MKEGVDSGVYCVTSVLKFSFARKFSNTMIQTSPVPSTAMRCEMQSMTQVLGKQVGGGDVGSWLVEAGIGAWGQKAPRGLLARGESASHLPPRPQSG